jgi:hypothetical protein
MAKASINIDIFGTHSCRSDSISSMGYKDVTIEEIMKSAGWSSATTIQTIHHIFCRLKINNEHSKVIFLLSYRKHEHTFAYM